ncbi:hypothetical protein [Aeromonas jandaei]|uniref:hypothetical protein n=1 Tax=Aeromonas jandaei TaxID=650 RepID=UPI001C049D18|nr:hypothetical protein [Aeromonas jandaei]QWL65772.1 hypothetical protein HQ398_05880 [Aeromonas jandaei]
MLLWWLGQRGTAVLTLADQVALWWLVQPLATWPSHLPRSTRGMAMRNIKFLFILLSISTAVWLRSLSQPVFSPEVSWDLDSSRIMRSGSQKDYFFLNRRISKGLQQYCVTDCRTKGDACMTFIVRNTLFAVSFVEN